MHPRAPGPVTALPEAEEVAVELILHGVHLHPAAASLAARLAGGTVLVTDAIAAAGAPDGRYRLGGQDVTVADAART